MFKRNLSDIIAMSLSFLGFNKYFYYDQENILKYFLKRDLTAIFGKDEFEIDYSNPQNSEIEIAKIYNYQKNTLIIKFNDQEYVIFNNRDILTIMDNKTKKEVASIKCLSALTNTLTYSDEKEKVVEVQKIYTTPEKIFETCKTIINSNGKIEYPPIRMRQMGIKNKNIELFSLTKLNTKEKNKSLIKKIVDVLTPKNIYQVQTSYETDDIYNYLENIYSIIDEEYKTEDNVLSK
jgi:hypothetical protein